MARVKVKQMDRECYIIGNIGRELLNSIFQVCLGSIGLLSYLIGHPSISLSPFFLFRCIFLLGNMSGYPYLLRNLSYSPLVIVTFYIFRYNSCLYLSEARIVKELSIR